VIGDALDCEGRAGGTFSSLFVGCWGRGGVVSVLGDCGPGWGLLLEVETVLRGSRVSPVSKVRLATALRA